jgi:hypothetical protein
MESTGRKWLNPTVLSLFAGVIIVLGLVWYFSSNRNPDQDKLINPQLQSSQAQSTELCTASDVYAIIKRQLFSRAAQVRGTDQSTFDRLAGVAVLRMENAVMEGEDGANRTVNCSGTLSLDLPPGVVVNGGRSTLTADVDYVVSPAGDAGALGVEVRGADPLIASLATLTEAPEPETGSVDANAVASEGNLAASESANKAVGPASTYPGRPSFDCARAETRGEIAVCSDGGLAALDVNMATQYRRALTTASAGQLQLLQTTRDRFLAYRDRCPNRQCMADAYVGRMREIRDIMEGRLTAR